MNSIYLLFMVVGFLIALVVAILLGVYVAGKKKKAKWKGGVIGALVVIVPIFWDWPLTVMAHQYYCKTEAGFWVYKTLEQWKAENPGVLETLHPNQQPLPEINQIGVYSSFNYQTTLIINERFGSIVKSQGPLFINVWEIESRIIDLKNNEIMNKRTDFYTSENGLTSGDKIGIKFWLTDGSGCKNDSRKLSEIHFNSIKGEKHD